MRKFILAASCLLLALPIQASSAQLKTNDTVIVHRDVGEQVESVIDHIATKLEVPAKMLYAVLMRQAVVEAWSWVVWALLWGSLPLIWWLGFKKAFQEDDGTFYKDSYSGEYGKLAYYLVGGLITFAGGLAFVGCMAQAVEIGLNPPYFAIQTILKALH